MNGSRVQPRRQRALVAPEPFNQAGLALAHERRPPASAEQPRTVPPEERRQPNLATVWGAGPSASAVVCCNELARSTAVMRECMSGAAVTAMRKSCAR